MNNISSQILLALPLPLESHLANITLSGSIITVETIPVFLARIPKKELGREYIIYSPAGEYEIGIWEDKLNTGLVTIQKYEFQNGFTNFVPIVNFILPDNVVIDADYVHTDNNFTNADKEKLDFLSNPDLSGYYTKLETDELLNDKSDINHNHDEVYAPVLGENDNYVTDEEKIILSNTSGTNTGDQDLSGYALTDHNHDEVYAPIIHDHTGQSINPDNVVIDKPYTDAEAAALAVGAIFYNSDQLCWMLKTSSVTYLNMGEELPMICKNGDSATHLEGQAVYITSGTGKLPVLQFANSTIGKCSALATQDVVNTGNGRGYYCFFGQVRTFPYANVIKSTDNEANWVEGAKLYLCSENGRYSTVKEAAPAKAMEVATITDRSGANISVVFNPIPVFAVEDLSNVDGEATTVASSDKHFIKIESEGLWKTISHENLVTKLQDDFSQTIFRTWES